MLFRRVAPPDFEKIIALQEKNLRHLLSDGEREMGFLSTAFTIEQFRSMDDALCVVVAIEQDELCGYIAATTPELISSRPIAASMLEHCSRIIYDGLPLTSYRSFIANPLCIAKEHRGKDVFVGLCEKLLELGLAGHELVLAFISSQNQRSLHACIAKMKMQVVGGFEAQGEEFKVLVRDFRSQN